MSNFSVFSRGTAGSEAFKSDDKPEIDNSVTYGNDNIYNSWNNQNSRNITFNNDNIYQRDGF